MLTREEIDRLGQLEKAATKGPWKTEPFSRWDSKLDGYIGGYAIDTADNKDDLNGIGNIAEVFDDETGRNANLIVAMRNALPELIRAARESAERDAEFDLLVTTLASRNLWIQELQKRVWAREDIAFEREAANDALSRQLQVLADENADKDARIAELEKTLGKLLAVIALHERTSSLDMGGLHGVSVLIPQGERGRCWHQALAAARKVEEGDQDGC